MSSNTKQNKPRLAAVVGTPITHSLSPIIHQYWAKKENISAYYIPVHIDDDDADFRQVILGLKNAGFSGVNVTLPHKKRALDISTGQTPTAELVGAANMLTFENDKIIADNSDVYGFMESIGPELDDFDIKQTSVVMIGAGGAAKGVLLGLQKLGFTDISIVNRNIENAQKLVNSDLIKVERLSNLNACLETSRVVVNTSTLGMTGAPPLEFDENILREDAVVMDIVYAPLETPLLHAAKNKGCKTIDGLQMLMHQAIPGYKQWLGNKAEVDKDLFTELMNVINMRAN